MYADGAPDSASQNHYSDASYFVASIDKQRAQQLQFKHASSLKQCQEYLHEERASLEGQIVQILFHYLQNEELITWRAISLIATKAWLADAH